MNVQESSSSNDAVEESAPSVEGGEIARASLDELETLVSCPDRLSDDWQAWEMIRDLSVGRMRNEDLGADVQLRWVRLALVANRLKRRSGRFDAASILVDDVYVQVFAIYRFGPRCDDPVLGPVETCRAVFREIHERLDDVVAATKAWSSLTKQEILRLRRIKNLLNILAPIMQFIPQEAPEYQALSQWLQIVPRRP
ncbi:hypothetical protein [Streptomyces pseudogriseolus]|uniref:hypothetical protein n=1 Tax=Streptomyces pseudogriseolus TaxID=36817 RepID=UPI001677B856|nr:hypothetical protein [Streptomyces rubiginosus]